MEQYFNLKKQLDTSLNQIEELEKKLSSLRKETASENFVTAQLNEFNNEILDLKQNATTIQNNLTTISNSVNTNTSEISALKQSLTNNAVLEGIQADITGINSRLDTLEENVNSITTNVNSNNSSISTLNSKYNSLTNTSNTMKSDITKLQNRVTTIETGMSGGDTTNQNSYYSKVYNCFNFLDIKKCKDGVNVLYYPLYIVSSKNCPLKIKLSADIILSEAIAEENSAYFKLNEQEDKIGEKSFSSSETTLNLTAEFNLIPKDSSTVIEINFEHSSSTATCILKNVKLELYGVNVACINQNQTIKFTACYDTYMCCKQTEDSTLYQINSRQNFDYTDETKYNVIPEESVYLSGSYNETSSKALTALVHGYCKETYLYYPLNNSFLSIYNSKQIKTTYLNSSVCLTKMYNNITNRVITSATQTISNNFNCGFSIKESVFNDIWFKSKDENGLFIRFWHVYNANSYATYYTFNNKNTINHNDIAFFNPIETINSNISVPSNVVVLTLKNGDNYIYRNFEYLAPVYIGFGWNIHIENRNSQLIVYKQVYDHVEKVTITYNKFGEFDTPTYETITGMCEYFPLCKGDYLYKVRDDDDYVFVKGEDYETTNKFIVEKINDYYILQGYDGVLSGEITIPTTDDEGNLIQRIAPMAFANQTEITKVTIPNSIIGIGAYCFYNCSNLQEVVFEGENPKNTNLALGKCFLKNTSVTSFVVPSHCNNIGYAFLNNSTIINLTLTPETINKSIYIITPNLTDESYRSLLQSLKQSTSKNYLGIDPNKLTDEEKAGLSNIKWALTYVNESYE